MYENLRKNHNLIVTIVKKGKAKKICEAAKKAGAEGGTTIMGKGTTVNDFRKTFGICLDDEREVVLTVVKEEEEDHIFDVICKQGKLTEPGNGISFVMELKKVDGIFHLLKGART